MNNLVLFFVVIVILAALPRLIAYITIQVTEGLKVVLSLFVKFLTMIGSFVVYVASIPLITCKEILGGAKVLKNDYQTAFNQQFEVNKRQKRQAKIKNIKKQKIAIEEASVTPEPIYKLIEPQTSYLDTPTFLRNGVFQMCNGSLLRDSNGNPVKTPMTTLFNKPTIDVDAEAEATTMETPTQTTEKPSVVKVARNTLETINEILLDSEGFEVDHDPYLV